MKKSKRSDVFNATNSLKVLSFLAEHPGAEYLNSDIQKATSISRTGVYIALKELVEQGLVSRSRRGRVLFYSIIYNDPVVRHFKVLRNILALRSVVSKLRPVSKRIILFGSASRGENDMESDVDLFILSNDPEAVKEKLKSIRVKSKIQIIVKTPSEFADLAEKEKVFYAEVDRGIVLQEDER